MENNDPFEPIELNNYQKVAAATNNIVTPGNVIDAIGFAGAMYGIRHLDSAKGIGVTMASFMADFIDGKAARATGTASELGEAVDATGDKIKLAFALPEIWSKDLAPRPFIAAIAIQNSLNAGLTIADRITNKKPVLHPSKSGKRAIFLEQWGLGLHVIGSEVKKHHEAPGQAIKMAGTVLGLVGLGFGVVATSELAKTYRDSKSPIA